jgi:hypothetical protein
MNGNNVYELFKNKILSGNLRIPEDKIIVMSNPSRDSADAIAYLFRHFTTCIPVRNSPMKSVYQTPNCFVV